MKKTIFGLLLSLLLSSIPLVAQQTGKPLIAKFLVEGGIEFGGDRIARVVFTDDEEQIMRAGRGGYLAIGGELQFAGIKQLMLRSSIGIKYNTMAADNANIRLTRFPVHLTPFWKINENSRLGAGITTHFNPRLKGDGFINDVNYKSKAGARFEFGYKWLALTYTSIRYDSGVGRTTCASSMGASISVTFPNK